MFQTLHAVWGDVEVATSTSGERIGQLPLVAVSRSNKPEDYHVDLFLQEQECPSSRQERLGVGPLS